MPERLPTFENAPLDEMVLGVQFDPLKAFKFQHFLLYWLHIRNKYPKIENQPPLPHIVEQQGIQPQMSSPGLLRIGDKLPSSRCWFLDNTGNELIQVQQDRFLRNWRQIQGNESYPRFQSLFEIFYQEWDGFQIFLQEEKLEKPTVDLCEITYVNFIETDSAQDGLSGLADQFTILRFKHKKNVLSTPDLFNFEARYALPDGRGRLQVEVSPNFRARDLKLVVNFTLTARGKPSGVSEEALKEWFQTAHEWIVRAFVDLTTPAMHKIWRKK